MKLPVLTPLDHLTAAFETLWEAKIHLLRTVPGVDAPMQSQLQHLHHQVASARDGIEKLLIELQEKPPAAPAPPPQ